MTAEAAFRSPSPGTNAKLRCGTVLDIDGKKERMYDSFVNYTSLIFTKYEMERIMVMNNTAGEREGEEYCRIFVLLTFH